MPAVLAPAMKVACDAITHSGLLKPKIATASNCSTLAAMRALAMAAESS